MKKFAIFTGGSYQSGAYSYLPEFIFDTEIEMLQWLSLANEASNLFSEHPGHLVVPTHLTEYFVKVPLVGNVLRYKKYYGQVIYM